MKHANQARKMSEALKKPSHRADWKNKDRSISRDAHSHQTLCFRGCSLPPKLLNDTPKWQTGTLSLALSEVELFQSYQQGSPSNVLIRVIWWGEDRPGQLFRPTCCYDTSRGTDRERREDGAQGLYNNSQGWVIQYAIVVPPSHFHVYLQDMKELLADMIDPKTRRVIGKAKIPLCKLLPGNGENAEWQPVHSGLYPIYSIKKYRNTESQNGQLLGQLSVTISIEWIQEQLNNPKENEHLNEFTRINLSDNHHDSLNSVSLIEDKSDRSMDRNEDDTSSYERSIDYHALSPVMKFKSKEPDATNLDSNGHTKLQALIIKGKELRKMMQVAKSKTIIDSSNSGSTTTIDGIASTHNDHLHDAEIKKEVAISASLARYQALSDLNRESMSINNCAHTSTVNGILYLTLLQVDTDFLRRLRRFMQMKSSWHHRSTEKHLPDPILDVSIFSEYECQADTGVDESQLIEEFSLTLSPTLLAGKETVEIWKGRQMQSEAFVNASHSLLASKNNRAWAHVSFCVQLKLRQRASRSNGTNKIALRGQYAISICSQGEHHIPLLFTPSGTLLGSSMFNITSRHRGSSEKVESQAVGLLSVKTQLPQSSHVSQQTCSTKGMYEDVSFSNSESVSSEVHSITSSIRSDSPFAQEAEPIHGTDTLGQHVAIVLDRAILNLEKLCLLELSPHKVNEFQYIQLRCTVPQGLQLQSQSANGSKVNEECSLCLTRKLSKMKEKDCCTLQNKLEADFGQHINICPQHKSVELDEVQKKVLVLEIWLLLPEDNIDFDHIHSKKLLGLVKVPCSKVFECYLKGRNAGMSTNASIKQFHTVNSGCWQIEHPLSEMELGHLSITVLTGTLSQIQAFCVAQNGIRLLQRRARQFIIDRKRTINASLAQKQQIASGPRKSHKGRLIFAIRKGSHLQQAAGVVAEDDRRHTLSCQIDGRLNFSTSVEADVLATIPFHLLWDQSLHEKSTTVHYIVPSILGSCEIVDHVSLRVKLQLTLSLLLNDCVIQSGESVIDIHRSIKIGTDDDKLVNIVKEVDIPITWCERKNSSLNPQVILTPPSILPIRLHFGRFEFRDIDRESSGIPKMENSLLVPRIWVQREYLTPPSLKLHLIIRSIGGLQNLIDIYEEIVGEDRRGNEAFESLHRQLKHMSLQTVCTNELKTIRDIQVQFEYFICLGSQLHDQLKIDSEVSGNGSMKSSCILSFDSRTSLWWARFFSSPLSLNSLLKNKGVRFTPLDHQIIDIIVHSEWIQHIQGADSLLEISLHTLDADNMTCIELGVVSIPLSSILYRQNGVEGIFPLQVRTSLPYPQAQRQKHSTLGRISVQCVLGTENTIICEGITSHFIPEGTSIIVRDQEEVITTRLEIVIEEARNLVRLSDENNEPPPTTYASVNWSFPSLVHENSNFQLPPLNDSETSIIPCSSNPIYAYVKTITFPYTVDGSNDNEWRQWLSRQALKVAIHSREQSHKDTMRNDKLIGNAIVDLGFFYKKSWNEINGWYHIHDPILLDRTRGQCKIRVLLYSNSNLPAEIEKDILMEAQANRDITTSESLLQPLDITTHEGVQSVHLAAKEIQERLSRLSKGLGSPIGHSATPPSRMDMDIHDCSINLIVEERDGSSAKSKANNTDNPDDECLNTDTDQILGMLCMTEAKPLSESFIESSREPMTLSSLGNQEISPCSSIADFSVMNDVGTELVDRESQITKDTCLTEYGSHHVTSLKHQTWQETETLVAEDAVDTVNCDVKAISVKPHISSKETANDNYILSIFDRSMWSGPLGEQLIVPGFSEAHWPTESKKRAKFLIGRPPLAPARLSAIEPSKVARHACQIEVIDTDVELVDQLASNDTGNEKERLSNRQMVQSVVDSIICDICIYITASMKVDDTDVSLLHNAIGCTTKKIGSTTMDLDVNVKDQGQQTVLEGGFPIHRKDNWVATTIAVADEDPGSGDEVSLMSMRCAMDRSTREDKYTVKTVEAQYDQQCDAAIQCNLLHLKKASRFDEEVLHTREPASRNLTEIADAATQTDLVDQHISLDGKRLPQLFAVDSKCDAATQHCQIVEEKDHKPFAPIYNHIEKASICVHTQTMGNSSSKSFVENHDIVIASEHQDQSFVLSSITGNTLQCLIQKIDAMHELLEQLRQTYQIASNCTTDRALSAPEQVGSLGQVSVIDTISSDHPYNLNRAESSVNTCDLSSQERGVESIAGGLIPLQGSENLEIEGSISCNTHNEDEDVAQITSNSSLQSDRLCASFRTVRDRNDTKHDCENAAGNKDFPYKTVATFSLIAAKSHQNESSSCVTSERTSRTRSIFADSETERIARIMNINLDSFISDDDDDDDEENEFEVSMLGL